jgi:predicted amidohydrolase
VRSRLLKVAAAGFAPRLDDPEGNLAVVRDLVATGLEKGVDLVVLPELSDSGYPSTFEEARRAARAGVWRQGVLDISDLLQGTRSGVVVGLLEGDGGSLFDSSFLVTAAGVTARYRKRRLWQGEAQIFATGSDPSPVVDFLGWNIAMAICYDLWSPVLMHDLAIRGADIVCVPCNWDVSDGRYYAEDFRAQIAAVHAHLNQVFIVTADRCGSEGGFDFVGLSTISAPPGLVDSAVPRDGRIWLAHDLDHDALIHDRETWPHLPERQLR